MRSYTTKPSKPDIRGRRRNDIGFRSNGKPARMQIGDHHTSYVESQRRLDLIKRLYECQCAKHGVNHWLEYTLRIAVTIGHGKPVTASCVGDEPVHLAGMVELLGHWGIAVEIDDFDSLGVGRSQIKARVMDKLLAAADEVIQRESRNLGPAVNTSVTQIDPERLLERRSLHDAIDAFTAHTKKHGKRKESGELALSPQNYIDWANRLKRTHENVRLADLGRDAVETIISHWRNRPVSDRTGRNISPDYAKHHIDCLWSILSFIDESEDWRWAMPNSCRRISRTPIALDIDRKKSRTNRIAGMTYSVDQLVTVASHMNKFEKLILGMMVNCGMQPAEIGRLVPDDLYPSHPERVDQATGTPEAGSRVIFERPKTFEYGEWILFDEVHKLLEWGIQRSQDYGGNVIICNDKGMPWYRDDQRNAAQRMTKWWGEVPNGKTVTGVGVITRVQRIDPSFPKHPLKNLRKVLPSLLRQKYGCEIADLSNARRVSRTSVTNRYSDPRFETLKTAILELRPKLQPLLDELAKDG